MARQASEQAGEALKVVLDHRDPSRPALVVPEDGPSQAAGARADGAQTALAPADGAPADGAPAAGARADGAQTAPTSS